MKLIFQFCPSCRSANIEFNNFKCYFCRACGWEFYFNSAASAGCILIYQEKIILIRRNREPGKGLLCIPGGFVDPGESAETAMYRELSEELNIKPSLIQYLGSYPNLYHYKGITYNTCDIVFTGKTLVLPQTVCEEEIDGIVLIKPGCIDYEKIAFDSIKCALKDFELIFSK